jgi:hypothetical protein
VAMFPVAMFLLLYDLGHYVRAQLLIRSWATGQEAEPM